MLAPWRETVPGGARLRRLGLGAGAFLSQSATHLKSRWSAKDSSD